MLVSGDFKCLETRTPGGGQHTQFADFYEDLEDLACKHLNLLDCWLSISEAGCTVCQYVLWGLPGARRPYSLPIPSNFHDFFCRAC